MADNRVTNVPPKTKEIREGQHPRGMIFRRHILIIQHKKAESETECSQPLIKATNPSRNLSITVAP